MEHLFVTSSSMPWRKFDAACSAMLFHARAREYQAVLFAVKSGPSVFAVFWPRVEGLVAAAASFAAGLFWLGEECVDAAADVAALGAAVFPDVGVDAEGGVGFWWPSRVEPRRRNIRVRSACWRGSGGGRAGWGVALAGWRLFRRV
jgi:hypothetical protein